MTKITFNHLDILSKEQLENILNTVINESYQHMKYNKKLIEMFNKKYDIQKDINKFTKNELINIILKFYPNSS